MKHSIKKRITLAFSILLAGAIIACWIANTLLLGNFYIRNKKNAIIEAYHKIDNQAQGDGVNSEAFSGLFDQIAKRDNLEMLIIDSDTKAVLFTGWDSRMLTDRLLGYIFRGYESTETLYEDSDIRVHQSFDESMNMSFIELMGRLTNGDIIFMRSPVESLSDSVKIANRFLGYVGIVVILLSIFVSNMISQKVSKPILNLADISEKVARLDFDAKYEDEGRQDEVALLGRSINLMSKNLEETISELKRANNELQVDIKRKTEIDEMRREFLSNVSHELKTPIALVQGYAEGLKDCVNDDEESRNYYCDVIIDEAGKMNRLVQQLMKLDQLENGHNEVDFERFDIVDMIESCVQSVDIMLKQSETTLKFEEAGPVYVWSDPFMIEQVINNYLSNAIHYVSGEKVIEISLERMGDKVRLKVFNTGENIPEESLDKLWTKFYKVDKARTREYGGSGIGLSIVKAIGDSLNRSYGVINYDNGVAFWFEVECQEEV